ncbi:MAG: hypothetical protein JG781_1163 [Peptococcaceae bacterium]|nr:hypothetical protein [Peptococcaceae bacterium]
MKDTVITDVRVVTPQEVINNASVYLHKGRIGAVKKNGINWPQNYEVIDGKGKWLLPGIIDLHNDAIEKEIEPRPNAVIPVGIALFSLETRLLSHGVTTIYHSFSFMEGESAVRTYDMVLSNVEEINRLKEHGLIRNYIHARYDVTEHKFSPILVEMMKRQQVKLLSFMDHTPGQGQYKNIEVYEKFIAKYRNLDEEAVKNNVIRRQAKKVDFQALKSLAEKARALSIPMASHDDDSADKVRFMKKLGVTLSEFPIDMETANFAAQEGLKVIVGGPNIIRGKSNSGNMSAMEAVKGGVVDIICSDYMPAAILNAIFVLHRRHNMPIHQAVNMGSLNPARAVGLEEELGSIECGKRADLVMVNEVAGVPMVEMAFVDGRKVMEKGFFRRDNAPELKECLG